MLTLALPPCLYGGIGPRAGWWWACAGGNIGGEGPAQGGIERGWPSAAGDKGRGWPACAG